jgi:phosphoribosylformylglycinamidine cyclo-ligase
LLALMESLEVKGMAHITGGGLVENVPRVLGDKLTAVLHKDAWTLPPLFTWLQQHGGVADAEMHRVFNCGIGMVVIVSAENADAAMAQLSAAGESVYRIGEIRAREGNEHPTIVV